MHRATIRRHLHDVAPAAERRHGKARAERLRQHRQIRPDPEQFLRAARGNPHPCQDLVEDQHRPVCGGQAPQPLHELGRRHHATGVARIGSTITAAISAPRSANERERAPTSFYGSTSSVCPSSGGIPDVDGVIPGASTGPASSSDGCADQWIASDQPW